MEINKPAYPIFKALTLVQNAIIEKNIYFDSVNLAIIALECYGMAKKLEAREADEPRTD